MKRVAALAAVLVAVACAALGRPGGADAHPLGNFTVNHYSGIELAGSRVYVRFVLDLAEIPTYQEGGRVRARGYAAGVARELELRVDGTRARLVPLAHRVSSRPGAGGLPTLRFEVIYRASRGGRSLSFADRTFASRIGWREITISARDGARLVNASAPATSRSDELRAYPQALLRSPLDVRTATARYVPGDTAGAAPVVDDRAAPAHRGGGFEALVERGKLSPGIVVLSLLVAAFWGAAHALTPGHGKALVAGYLIGTRGRPRDAVLLGATVTATHTAGVFGLGLVTLLLSRFVVPEQLYPWLTLVSGLLVVAVGAAVLRQRLRGRRQAVSDFSRTPAPAPEHHHGHDHHHHHGVRRSRNRGHLLRRHRRSWDRGGAPAVPFGTRASVERPRPPSHRVRLCADRRVQPRARLDDHRHRPGRGARPARLLARQPRRSPRPAAARPERVVVLLIGVARTVRAIPGVVDNVAEPMIPARRTSLVSKRRRA